jgi:hypothetical protein
MREQSTREQTRTSDPLDNNSLDSPSPVPQERTPKPLVSYPEELHRPTTEAC